MDSEIWKWQRAESVIEGSFADSVMHAYFLQGSKNPIAYVGIESLKRIMPTLVLGIF